MPNKLILHIPHSSSNIPLYEGYVISKNELHSEILKLTDWYTDELFFSKKDVMIVANFSRIFCDPERFAEDDKEIMSRVGMGVLYEKTDDGRQMRNISNELRYFILDNYYFKHHEALSSSVKKELQENKQALIIDCHSFSNTPFIRDIDKSPNRPDINIGTDSFHTPKELIDFTTNYFKNKGFGVGVDYPYSGTIVPSEYYKQDKRVISIMIEVNRKLYIDENTIEKNENFVCVKRTINDYLMAVKQLLPIAQP